MKTRSPSASHSLEGEVAKSTTVKWSISNFIFKKSRNVEKQSKRLVGGGLWSHCRGRLTLEPLREKLQ